MSADLAYAAAFVTARLGEDKSRASRLLEIARDAIGALKEPRLLGREVPGWHSWPDVEAMCSSALRDVEAKRVIVAACTRAAEADPYGPAGVLALAVLDAMCLEWEHPDRPFVPDWTLRPGVLLRKALEAQGKSPDGIPGARLIIEGTRRVDARHAARIAETLGTSAETWLNAQRLYDAAILRGATDTSEGHEHDQPR
jgi:hypothetical protein